MRVLRTLLALWLSLTTVSTISGAEFIPLGGLPGKEIDTRARSVSDDGNVVVGNWGVGEQDSGFIWRRDEGMSPLDLDFAPDGTSFGPDVSADGTIVAGNMGFPAEDFHTRAYVWSENQGTVLLDRPAFISYGISKDSSVVVGYATPGDPEDIDAVAFRWTQAEQHVELLGTLPGCNHSTAYDASTDGTVIVGAAYGGCNESAFRWTEEDGMVSIGSGNARKVSADGSTVAITDAGELMRWREDGGRESLGILGPYGGIRGINGDGTAIVGWRHDSRDVHQVPIVWTEQLGITDLADLLGAHYGLGPSIDDWDLDYLGDISSNSLYLVGAGYNPDGLYEAFLVELDPDFDGNFQTDAADIDLLAAAIRDGDSHYRFDMDGSGQVDEGDLRDLVHEKLNSWFGDANLDGEFNSGDLVAVFTAGKYETVLATRWADGDWNGDGMFGSGDLVLAFQDGGYEQGPHAAVNTVPEPGSVRYVLIALITILVGLHRR